MFRKAILAAAVCLTAAPLVRAERIPNSEMKALSDTLRGLLKDHTTVFSTISLDRVDRNGNTVNLRFSRELSDYSWQEDDIKWFRGAVKKFFPSRLSSCKVGKITFSRSNTPIEDIITPALPNDGNPVSDRFRISDPRGKETPFIENPDAPKYNRGLSGRNIAVWQSHGRYWEESTQRWEWQRSQNLNTVEDMFTQSFVLPYVIPMLENAGAYVMTPRERDIQRHEVVCDNDPSFRGAREGLLRKTGTYREKGKWADADTGFADTKAVYAYDDNPFKNGTARYADVKREPDATATWSADIPQRGAYSVYVAYKSLPNSTKSAHYTVRHLGGKTSFIVNQTIGGGTWIYLGTFEFGSDATVTLDNGTPEDRPFDDNTVVTADAVRFGGGMGKFAFGEEDAPEEEKVISGVPAYQEGAMYSMLWGGFGSSFFQDWDNSYTRDYASRGKWVSRMTGGSRMYPHGEGLGIPIELSMAFHSDAGVTYDQSTIGTLSIYTSQGDSSTVLPDGTSRLANRELADFIQSQIVDDIRAGFDPEWNRRQLWDRNYNESRTPAVPSMLLELLSHQNFADMKYGLDPTFRFTVSRAIYKGMLKFISNRYGCDYTVQPLPVKSFSATLSDDLKTVTLSWLPVYDPLEPTAEPEDYLIRVRMDDGGFSIPKKVEEVTGVNGRIVARFNVEPGHLYSYEITAVNKGGKSFPSEILSVGVPALRKGKVTVVNNFTRISAPSWYETADRAAFDREVDSGVPDRMDISYIGKQYISRRDLDWQDDDCPGFGASRNDESDLPVIGNTFDYPAVHGRAIMAAGYAFDSMSESAFSADPSSVRRSSAIDIICGKQVTTVVGNDRVPRRYSVFPERLRKAISDYTFKGGNIIISGTSIGADMNDEIYNLPVDSVYVEKARKFAHDVLGYTWRTSFGSLSGTVAPFSKKSVRITSPISYHTGRNPYIYRVENPDGLIPATDRSDSFLRYTDTNISAAVAYQGRGYKSVSFGFPLETIKDPKDLKKTFEAILSWMQE